MFIFIATAMFVVPIGVVSGFLAIGWAWDFISSCFFNLSYYCGADKSFKMILFGAISVGCFTLLTKIWKKSHS